MEGLNSFYEHLQNLRSQAEKLIDARLDLNALFAEEGTRLQREDEVSSLRVAYGTIAEKLKELRGIEVSASYEDSRANAILFVTGLAREAIVSKDNRASAMKDYLYYKSITRYFQCPKSRGNDASEDTQVTIRHFVYYLAYAIIELGGT